MKNYKVEVYPKFCIDIQAEDEKEIRDKAEEYLYEAMRNGTAHYLSTGETEYIVYDVTDTDDPFNPI